SRDAVLAHWHRRGDGRCGDGVAGDVMDIDLRSQRVLVVGIGIEGVDLVRFAVAEHAARVTANDARGREDLVRRIEDLAGLPVEFALGGHDPALARDHDVVLVSQGVRLDLPLIAEARRQGKPVASLTSIFLSRCRGPVLGVTGSSGKTTTTALLGAMFREAGLPHVVGGNIGVPLLSRLAEIDERTWVVLEVSHTQLELTDRSPHVAAVTNVTPNHLDRYTWDAYVRLKRNFIIYQRPEDFAILNYDDPVTRSFADDTTAKVNFTTMGPTAPGDGAYLPNGVLTIRRGLREVPVLPAADIPLRGTHNVANSLTAIAAADAAGVPVDAMARAIRSFPGVPHRLEPIGTIRGVTWVNDSIATTPERTLAGMRSFTEPLVVLLGGRGKNLPFEELASEAASRCRAVVCFGEEREELAQAMREAGVRTLVVENIDEAVNAAADIAEPGDVVLFSPACTSFDAFDNFEQRGEAFRACVRMLAERWGEEVPS
ncbi:MAG TPA: UDP-N-acetylmuramoyl-L-alanine--D-glutamate ligase, partial [Dehalococcoidia bacterium]|nr:UDP-N-acetylmuramoyl-L-alanine--D-glutamate ligase [Dehalococcoidia bacterium]